MSLSAKQKEEKSQIKACIIKTLEETGPEITATILKYVRKEHASMYYERLRDFMGRMAKEGEIHKWGGGRKQCVVWGLLKHQEPAHEKIPTQRCGLSFSRKPRDIGQW